MKKLLIITQKVNATDPILGFFIRWIEEFSKHFSSVTVICLEKGECQLPANVRVLSLGKELGASRYHVLLRFIQGIWSERNEYDTVFVHMNPIYVIVGGFFWHMLGKKVSLWYTHKHVDFKLRLATKIADRIFTASKESFLLTSPKVLITGHGMDIIQFPLCVPPPVPLVLISVSRISATKNQKQIIEVLEALRQEPEYADSKLVIVGAPITSEDGVYQKEIVGYVQKRELSAHVTFVGPVVPKDIQKQHALAHVFINMSDTGSLDKAVLEAMLSGLIVITTNRAFRNILPAENFVDQKEATPQMLAQRIQTLHAQVPNPSIRDFVVKNHNLASLIPRLSKDMSQN